MTLKSATFDTSAVLARFHLDSPHPGAYSTRTGWSPTDVPADLLIDAVCPADGKVIAQVAPATEDDYDRIVEAAVDAQLRWRMVPPPERGAVVRRIGQLIEADIDNLAALISLDTGKSLMEAKGELRESVDMSTLAAGQSRMLNGVTQQSQRAEHRLYDQWLPLGVVGVISAYNFPANVWAQNSFLAAIGGNTVIWKPSPKVPLTALALQQLANRACEEFGHENIFSFYLPADNEGAQRLVEDERIAMISFTGSAQTGQFIAKTVSNSLGRRSQLECAGNNGCIVDETADIEQAAKALTFGVIGTTGQRCTSTRRIIAHESVVERLVALMCQAFAQIEIGDPRDPDSIVGPLIDEAAVVRFREVLTRAENDGARIVHGGRVIDRPGLFVEPTIVIDARADSEIVQTETFAPIVTVLTYSDFTEAIALHNGVSQGLASGIHSTNISHIEQFLSARGSDCGIVRVNMGTTGADVGAAFGGEKDTGRGRTAGSDAWKQFMRHQSVCINWSGTTAWDERISL